MIGGRGYLGRRLGLCYNAGAMPLLIDGHNLIGRGQLPGLRLDDPDDEAKLVTRLRAYCARARKRATVVFDRGLPGGRHSNQRGPGKKTSPPNPPCGDNRR